MVRLPDSRERTALITFLKLYWDVRDREHPQILQAIGHQFSSIRELRLPPWSSACLLQFCRHAVSTSPEEAIQEFADLTFRCIVPLIVSAHLRLFLADLKEFLAEFHRVWPELRILSLWNIQKECSILSFSVSQFCVDLIVSIVIQLDRRLFALMANTFFAWFGELLYVPNFHVALTVLGIIVPQNGFRDDYQNFVRHQSTPLIRRCYHAIVALAHNHWHDEVRARAEEVIKVLTQLNLAEVHLEQKKKGTEAKPKGRRSWLKILSLVQWEGMKVSQEEMNLKVEELYLEQPDETLNSRFMPCPRQSGAKELYKEGMRRLTMKKVVELET
jgi:hypothetical protein